MKRFCLLLVLITIPVFAGQIMLDLSGPVSKSLSPRFMEASPALFAPSPDETLKYDHDAFDNGIGIYSSGSPFIPTVNQAYGFATYFILHTLGLTKHYKVKSLMVNFNNVTTAIDFRLYVWRNVINPPGTLRPWSHYTTFPYDSLHIPIPPSQTWGEWDISSEHVVLRDTAWIGVTYNEIAVGSASWYLACETGYSDLHTYINLNGGPGGWVLSDYPNPFGVRAIIEELSQDVGPVSIDIPAVVSPGTKLAPKATVKNFATDTADFNVTCTINPGGYSSLYAVNNLAPAESIQVVFPDSFTFATGSYNVTVITGLIGDEYPANDTLKTSILTGIAEGGLDGPKVLEFKAPTINNNKTAHIEFTLPEACHVTFKIYDVIGRTCATLVSEKLAAGTHKLSANLDLPSGLYFYDLRTPNSSITRKFLIIH